MSAPAAAGLGWAGIARLGLVQMSLGAIVVLMTSTINRVMVVELALPAFIPGLLVALHYAVQLMRPRWGYGSDMGGRRTPWVVCGMAVLALGGIGAALSVPLIAASPVLGLAFATLSFLAVGMGVGAAGTTVLVLMAARVAPQRRAAAATTVWIMMIAGLAVSASLAGHFLEHYSPERLLGVTATVAIAAFCLATLAVQGVEGPPAAAPAQAAAHRRPPFREAIAQVWGEPQARRFTIFIFVSMLAYSGQELILEPYAGFVFGMAPGATTKLSGIQHGGVLFGMIFVALITTQIGGRIFGSLRLWTVTGCVASAIALVGVAAGGLAAEAASSFAMPLRVIVFILGFSNGVFAAAAIGSMMALVAAGAKSREGTRMGLWGAAQGVAFGVGGFLGAVGADVARQVFGAPVTAYACVFAFEAALFLVAARLAFGLARPIKVPLASRVGSPAGANLAVRT